MAGPQSDYWSSVAESKTFTHPIDRELLAPYLSVESRILDIGCGYGRAVAELLDAGYKNLVGVDTASRMVARGKIERPELDLREISAGKLPFDDGSFDLVLLVSVLTCIPEDRDLDELIAEVERILRPGGVAYVSDLYVQSDKRNRARYADLESGVFELPEGVRLRHFSQARLNVLFERFRVAQCIDFDAVTMNGNRAKAFRLVLQA